MHPTEPPCDGTRASRKVRALASQGYAPLRAALKWTAHRHPLLLAAARSMRDWFFPARPAPARLLPGFEPLCLDENQLADFARLSPSLRDEIVAEFASVRPVLGGVLTGLSDPYYHNLAQRPLDDLLTGATDLHFAYTPGKVGSQTIAATMEHHPSMRFPVRFVHFLSSSGIALLEQLIARCASRPNAAAIWRDGVFLARWLRAMLATNRALRKVDPTVHKPFVVSGVREPVALHVSFMFECWWMYADSPQELTADFVRARLFDDAWHRHCNDWLSNELGTTFGINVYDQPFPASRGWDLYENDSARVLVIRQESLAGLTEALGALYGYEPASFNVITKNTASTKAYALHYESVKRELNLTRAELDAIYALPYVRHFYTPGDIAAFKRRWQAPAASARSLQHAA